MIPTPSVERIAEKVRHGVFWCDTPLIARGENPRWVVCESAFIASKLRNTAIRYLTPQQIHDTLLAAVRECHDCESEGSIAQGGRMNPNSLGWQTCPTCNGLGYTDTEPQLRELVSDDPVPPPHLRDVETFEVYE